MKEFIINNHIKLKFEDKKTNIYLNNELFRQCKYLVINISREYLENFEDLGSIDEAEVILDSFEAVESIKLKISPEQEFWAHCSNLQAWVENDYNTRLLHRTIAFPLLRKLADLGDSYAKITLKDEIIERFKSGDSTVIKFLISEGFIEKYVKEEMLESFLSRKEINTLNEISKIVNNKPEIVDEIRFFDQPRSSQFSLLFNKGKLSGIDLRFNNLREFPSLVLEFKDLEGLYLDDNIIKTLPEEICRLKNLKKLSLSRNALINLPISISLLQSLECISLSINEFIFFPEPITKLKNLKYLNIGMNHIKTIPDSIKELQDLRIFVLNYNDISFLPRAIIELASLQYLSLQNNRLEALPRRIFELRKLEVLEVEGNPLISDF